MIKHVDDHWKKVDSIWTFHSMIKLKAYKKKRNQQWDVDQKS